MSHIFVTEESIWAHPCWVLQCDRCADWAFGTGNTTETAQKRSATHNAELRGWDIGAHGEPDYCGSCMRELGGSLRHQGVTRLYDENGQALKYKGAR